MPRRFPPPWPVEETDACFIVKDQDEWNAWTGCARPRFAQDQQQQQTDHAKCRSLQLETVSVHCGSFLLGSAPAVGTPTLRNSKFCDLDHVDRWKAVAAPAREAIAVVSSGTLRVVRKQKPSSSATVAGRRSLARRGPTIS